MHIGLVISSLLLVFTCKNAEADCHVTIVAPNQLRISTTESIYLDFHECSATVDANVEIVSLPNRQNPIYSKRSEAHPQISQLKVEFKIMKEHLEQSRQSESPVKMVELSVSYCSEPALSCNSRRTETLNLNMNFTHGYAFMTTDRPAYKPSEEVKIAVVSTQQNLLLTEETRSVTIQIRIPHKYGYIIVEKSTKTFDVNGMLEYTYSISDDPMKGIWWAEAVVGDEVMASTSFVIDKYVATTYDVKIIPDKPYILPTQTKISGRIMAKYSYGEDVDGSYYISMRLVRPNGQTIEFYKVPSSFRKTASFVAGRQDFSVNTGNIQMKLPEGETMLSLLDGSKVQILATVASQGSSEVVTDLFELIFTKSPYVIDYSQSSRFYVPNTIYQVQATVKNSVTNQPVGNVPVTIEWNDGSSQERESDSSGFIYHEIDSFEADEYTINISTADINLNPQDQFSESYDVRKSISDEQLVLSINKRGRDIKLLSVGEEYFLKLGLGQSAPNDIRIYMISRGVIVKNFTKVAGRNGEVSIDFTVTADMVPEFRILAYYVLNNVVTANSAWFDVEDQCKSELTIEVREKDVKPNGPVDITFSGAANSKVYMSGVDRAAYFIHNDTRLTRESLWTKMKAYDPACSIQGGRNAASVFRQAGMVIQSKLIQSNAESEKGCSRNGSERKKRNVANVVETYSVLEKCNSSGRIPPAWKGMSCAERAETVSRTKHYENMERCLELFMSSCEEVERSRYKAKLTRSALVQRSQLQRLDRARKNFSPSWFFRSGKMDDEGKLVLNERARDSITIFDVQAFGWGKNAPFCIAKPKEVKVFQKFFLKLFLPYSVRLREQATIRFALFNYGDQAQTAHIFIKHEDDLCSNFKFGDYRHMTSMTVEPQSSTSSYLTVLPMKIPAGGTTTISLKAVTENRDYEDWIEKKLLIEERGQQNESYGSFLLEPNSEPITFRFDIAKSSVDLGSRKCEIYLYAHPMGPSEEVDPFNGRLVNLGEYIKIPTGCGEQNMIRIAPTVYIHNYRLATHSQITEVQINQVIDHIQKAYARELRWRSDEPNHAFAVWNHKPPSTWLNAFVTKVFAQARHYWLEMELEPICGALEWMLTQQVEATGHFKENFRVYHDEMRGFVVDDITRTAYVSISLSEVEDTCPDVALRMQESRRRALSYVAGKFEDAKNSPYALAMGAYALALDNSIQAERWLKRLDDLAREEGAFTFWKGTRGRAADIETTAYVLLAELTEHKITQKNELLTRSIARWLISNRNEKGGFISTQDTVVALQALSAYMTLLETTEFGPPPTNLTVKISSNSGKSPWNAEPVLINLTRDDVMRRKTVPVPEEAIDEVSASVEGDGVGSMAYRCTWRQYADDGECNFNVEVSLHEDDEEEDVNILKIAVSKVVGEPAQMSIIDIIMLTGFSPDIESVKRLSAENFIDGEVDRFEQVGNTLKLYLSKISNITTKIAFKIKEEAKVNNRQPASVTVYDYQEPGIRCTKFYSETGRDNLRATCTDNDQTCKCAEGDCLRCRTRQEQLDNTTCSNMSPFKNRCNDLCKEPGLHDDYCLNLHKVTCQSDYAYIVQVAEVSQSPVAGFKRFIAFVENVIRLHVSHPSVNGTNVTFHIRNDCYDQCTDERLVQIAKKKKQEAVPYIWTGRRLLVYGKAPNIDRNKDPVEIIYDLDADAGLEIMPSAHKCSEVKCEKGDKKCKKKSKSKKLKNLKKVCKALTILREAHNRGCDI